jgi:outer membrane protein OmpA-like peptidoglycan-associated protein
MRHFYLLSALTVGAAALVTSSAQAEDASLHLEPGMVAPLSNPQNEIFQPGVALDTKLLFNLNHNLALGPSVSALYLPRMDSNGNQNAGVAWQMGGSIRLQGDRRPHRNEDGGWSPWVDADVMAAYTGHLPLLGLSVGAGVEVAMDRAHEAWIGPFLRGTHIFQTANTSGGQLLDKSDVNLITGGVSVSFDFPPHTYTRTHTVVETKTVEKFRVLQSPTEKSVTTVVVPVELNLIRKVYFDWDKSVLRWESRDKLDEVVAELKKHPELTVKIQGHASSDGMKVHNEKLAADRSAAVVQYLTDHGVEARRLQGESFGIDMPSADNAQQEGRERNRRVEFVVTFSSVQK